MKQLTNQWTSQNFRDERRQRLYLKDIDCPIEWRNELQSILYPSLFYLNDNVTTSAPSSTTRRQRMGEGQDNNAYPGESATAPAGDLMSSLPEEMRAENLMCYIGHEGTYTPAHREMCASVGHNIMVEASGNSSGERSGSSIWFMTESKDRDVVREYFLSMLGHDIEIEKHFAQINAWKKAPFDVYLVDQRAGDFIIIPPLAAHQVWNRGTRTMKVAWNRTTPETLRLALREALPKARLVCRDEQYKNKAIIYFTLHKYYELLREMERQEDITQNSFMGIGRDIVRNSPRARQLAGEFKSLFSLFTEILVDEAFAYKEKQVETLPFDSCVTCSYCRSNIFNRFLTCKHCTRTLVSGDEDAYDICMECYAMGRSCACLSGLQWCEQWSWSELSGNYELWRELVIKNDGFVDLYTSPPPLDAARQRSAKKSVAQICQEALLRRPWKDITKQDYDKAPSDSDQEEVEDGSKNKTKRKPKQGEVRRCHVCCHKDYSYRVHECSNPDCTEAYCYGVLYRAFDMTPQTVLQDENWQCPKCLGICNCGYCRRAGNTNPYTPRNTSLGHDTRPIADDRSIEALVDFRVHNLSWLKAAGEESRSRDSRRMQRLRRQADHAKAQNTLNEAGDENALLSDAADCQEEHEGMAINTNAERHAFTSQGTNSYPTRASGARNVQQTSVALQPRLGSTTSSPVAYDGTSPYPDPSMTTNYGIGMGYYEQDNTPDKILFDPYKAPSSGTATLADLEVPDSVKKSIRAAKRKAKRDNEDPDFLVGRSSHKKARHIRSTEVLDNMDPALFGTSSAMTLTNLRQIRQPSIAEDGSLGNQHESSEVTELEATIIRMPGEPALRRARPLASYVEVDDIEAEEPETEVDQIVSEGTGQGSPADNDSSDLVKESHMLRAKQNNPELSEVDRKSQVISERPKSTRGGRGRGRPRNRLPRDSSGCHEAESSPIDSASQSNITAPRRGRGRPKKLVVVSIEQSDIPPTAGAPASNKHDRTLRETRKLAEVDAESHQRMWSNSLTSPALRRRRDQRVAIPGSTETKTSQDVVALPKAIHIEVPKTHTLAKDGESWSPQADGKTQTVQSNPTSSIDKQFMSMAERLALKGKKFKMAKRRDVASGPLKDNRVRRDISAVSESIGKNSHQASSPTADHEDNNHRDQPQPQRRPQRSPPARASIPDRLAYHDGTASKPSGEFGSRRTVVRLTDVVSSGGEDEMGKDRSGVSSDDSDDSDDGDIPASGVSTAQRSTTGPRNDVRVRGLGGGRGGGRGRGRGRGRPSGRGRSIVL